MPSLGKHDKLVYLLVKKEALPVLAHARAGPTLAGFRLLKALRKCPNPNTNNPKECNRKRCSFSKMSTLRESLLPSSKLIVPEDILVAVHSEKDTKLHISTFRIFRNYRTSEHEIQ